MIDHSARKGAILGKKPGGLAKYVPPDLTKGEYGWRKVSNTEIELTRHNEPTGVTVIKYPWGYFILAEGEQYGSGADAGYESAEEAKSGAQYIEAELRDQRELAEAAPIEFVKEVVAGLREEFRIPKNEIKRPGGEVIVLSTRAAQNLDLSIRG